MATTRAHARPFLVLLAAAVAIATAVKLYISFSFEGTIDVVYWQQFLGLIRRFGSGVYRSHELFNHPPFMIHVLRAAGALADASGLSLAFWLRFPGILADAGSVVLVWLIARRSLPDLDRSVLLLLLALAPASILISGYHGNTDPIMVCMLLLAVYAMEAGSPWAAGLAFGMAMSFKVVPVIFVPAFVAYRRTIRGALAFGVTAGATFVATGMPYVLDDPAFLAQRIFGYAGGSAAWWGLPLLVRLTDEHMRSQAIYSETWRAAPGMRELYSLISTASAAYARWGTATVLGSIAVLSLWLNRRERRPALFVQCGIVALVFLFFMPSFGPQYLAWVIPWAVAAGPLAAILFYEASGALLGWLYVTHLQPNVLTIPLSLACWASIGVAGLVLWQRAQAAMRAPDAARSRWTRRVARAALAGLATLAIAVGVL
ncbi:MAG: glycosyltransferase 87 family protein, partial [Candidatus Binatia bacterium]